MMVPAPSFLHNRQGSVIAVFAAVVAAVFLAVGVGVDYTRALAGRTRLQAATDAYVLALARNEAMAGKANGAPFEQANFAVEGSQDFVWYTYQRDTNTGAGIIAVTAEAGIKTSFLKLINITEIKVGSVSRTGLSSGALEIAMVLDNTSSMDNGGRMTALKQAANAFIDTLEKMNGGGTQVKISVVPYNEVVRVGKEYKTAPWLDPNGVTMSAWNGCVLDREPPYDNQNDMPDPSRPSTLYDAEKHKMRGSSDKDYCGLGEMAAILPLTSDFTQMRSRINAMTSEWGTNIPIGLMWGWNMLTPGAPLSQATGVGQRIIILMTDGENTFDRWGNHLDNGKSYITKIDNRMNIACQNVKAAGITIYTVRILEGNSSLLQSCASNPSYFFNVTNVNHLSAVFQNIAAGFGTKLRLME